MPVCLGLKSVSSLALATRNVSDSFRFLIGKSKGWTFRHFGKCVLLYLHSEEKELGEHFNCLTLRFIVSVFCRGFAEILESAKECRPGVLFYQSRAAAFCIHFCSPSCGSCGWLSEVFLLLGRFQLHLAGQGASSCPKLCKIYNHIYGYTKI